MGSAGGRGERGGGRRPYERKRGQGDGAKERQDGKEGGKVSQGERDGTAIST